MPSDARALDHRSPPSPARPAGRAGRVRLRHRPDGPLGPRSRAMGGPQPGGRDPARHPHGHGQHPARRAHPPVLAAAARVARAGHADQPRAHRAGHERRAGRAPRDGAQCRRPARDRAALRRPAHRRLLGALPRGRPRPRPAGRPHDRAPQPLRLEHRPGADRPGGERARGRLAARRHGGHRDRALRLRHRGRRTGVAADLRPRGAGHAAQGGPGRRADPRRGRRVKLAFLGAATTVTGSQFLLTTARARVLVDCGMFQGSPHESERNRLGFALEPAALDAELLTHAHLDHCGLLPLLVKEGFRGAIHATHPTVELARLILLDSGKLQVEQAKDRVEWIERRARRAEREAKERGLDHEAAIRAHPAEIETEELEPLYDVADAGHILGSAIITVDAADAEGDAPTRIVFSGDLGRPNTPIIHDPTAVLDGADYVLVESTYGGREHEPGDEAIRLLAEAVQTIAGHSGVLLIPSFAIGRTQEVVWVLDRLLEAGRIPHVPLYLDSPMASRASDVYRAFPGYYDEETRRLLETGETPLDYPGAVVTRTADESKAIKFKPRPMMIVSSNGMLTGGRIVHHLRDLIDDPAAMILFVGYQGEGTLGAHLQAGARTVRIDGAERAVRCEVRSISGFSAHADESELVDWLRHFAAASRRPRRVFLVHGDPEAEIALERRVRELGLEPYRPAFREEVEL